MKDALMNNDEDITQQKDLNSQGGIYELRDYSRNVGA